jgi:hypothetical protein
LDVCQSFSACVLQRLDQMRMGMAQRIDGDAGGKIEIALAGLR